MKAELFVDSRCELGEGVFWHPLLKRLFWFDIVNQTLLSAGPDGQLVDRFTFKDSVSAAGVIDEDRLLIAHAGALLDFSLSKDSGTPVIPFEADKPGNRPNDGRVDRTGGLWIGTMSRKGGAEPTAGSLYRYRAGELVTLLSGIGIPNSTCFAPDMRTAYFTHDGIIRKCATDPSTGLPVGEWIVFADDPDHGVADGAVVDTEGCVWSARWKGSAVVRYTPAGKIDTIVELPVSHVTCPAFGDDDLKTLYITSARQGLSDEQLEREPLAGSTFAVRINTTGLGETLVKL
jgi:sugar lactone lactonase YvrE